MVFADEFAGGFAGEESAEEPYAIGDMGRDYASRRKRPCRRI